MVSGDVSISKMKIQTNRNVITDDALTQTGWAGAPFALVCDIDPPLAKDQ